jgi:hypothetical protein
LCKVQWVATELLGFYNRNHRVIEGYLTDGILNAMRRLREILFGEQNVKYV